MGTTLHKQCGPLRRGRPRTAVTPMFGDGLAARHSWAFLPETQSASYTSSFLLHRMQCLLHKMIHLLRGVRLNEGQFQLPLCLDEFNHRLSEGKKNRRTVSAGRFRLTRERTIGPFVPASPFSGPFPSREPYQSVQCPNLSLRSCTEHPNAARDRLFRIKHVPTVCSS